MENIVYFALITGLILFFTLACFSIYRKLPTMPGMRYMMLFFICSFLFIFCYLRYSYEPVVSDALTWYRFMYPASALVMTFLLLFAMSSANPYYRVGRGVIFLVMIVPAATFIITAIGSGSTLMFVKLDIPVIYPRKVLDYQYGFWFYVNTAYCYFSLLLSATMFYQVYRNSSQSGKWQAQLYITGIAACLVLDIANVFGIFEFETTLAGLCLMCVIFYYVIVRFRASDLAFLAKDAAFEKISSAVVILEDNGNILFGNTVAKALFAFRGGKIEGYPYDRLIAEWLGEKDGEYIENFDDFSGERAGMVIVRIREDKDRYFELLQSGVMNKQGKNLGEFVEIRDVTTQQELIAQLNKLVYFDQLTGLHNRRYFDKICEKYTGEKYLPLAFIVGDLNRLKFTNDAFGHAVGDRLLVLISGILRKYAPERAVVSRNTGDEFFIVIPNCGEQEARGYIDSVSDYCAGYSEEPFGKPDISLGYAVKTDTEKSNGEFLVEADMSMYKVKKCLEADGRGSSRVRY
ncbi:MAG: diguanylate cyclase [Defluviitaleaceae bacterium]|nr:diguanylate cyclase [Defluviitaleaceae bacterium]